MKFIPAFLSLFLFSTLAYMVWTGEYPYHLIPVDEFGDPQRVQRISGYVDGLVGKFGSMKTGAALMITGLVLSLYCVMGPKDTGPNL